MTLDLGGRISGDGEVRGDLAVADGVGVGVGFGASALNLASSFIRRNCSCACSKACSNWDIRVISDFTSRAWDCWACIIFLSLPSLTIYKLGEHPS